MVEFTFARHFLNSVLTVTYLIWFKQTLVPLNSLCGSLFWCKKQLNPCQLNPGAIIKGL